MNERVSDSDKEAGSSTTGDGGGGSGSSEETGGFTFDTDGEEATTGEVIGGEASETQGPLSGGDLSDRRVRKLLLPLREDVAEKVVDGPFEVAERYWLIEPFAYAAILYNTRKDEYHYRVVEPDLNEHEHYVFEELVKELREHLIHRAPTGEDEAERQRMLEERARRAIDELPGLSLAEPSFQKVLYYLQRDLIHFDRIEPLMHDPRLEEISCNAPDVPVFIYHRDYEDLATNIKFDRERLRPFIKKLAQRSGKDISTAKPMQGTALPDGSRIQLTLEEIAPRGENFTIRKFREVPFTPVDLVRLGTFTVEQMAYLWTLIAEGMNGIVVGGTGAGKTTTMNALSMFIPPKSKVVSIEDTREIQIPQDNWVASLTREPMTDSDDSTGIDMFDLLRGSLRQRPEYIIVGEVRGSEAHDMFEAMSTGHTTYSTIHADSVDGVINRLKGQRMGVETELIGELDFLIIQTTAQVAGEKARRSTEVVEVLDTADREVNTRQVFEWSELDDTIEQVNRSAHAEQLRAEGKDPDTATEQRREVLLYLVDNGIDGYDAVSTVVRAYGRSPDRVIDQVHTGRLDFAELEELDQTHAA